MKIISFLKIPEDLGLNPDMVAFTQTIEIKECDESQELVETIKSNTKKDSPFYLKVEHGEFTFEVSGSVLSFKDDTLQVSTRMKSDEPKYICRLLEIGCVPNKEVVDFCEIRIPRLDE